MDEKDVRNERDEDREGAKGAGRGCAGRDKRQEARGKEHGTRDKRQGAKG